MGPVLPDDDEWIEQEIVAALREGDKTPKEIEEQRSLPYEMRTVMWRLIDLGVIHMTVDRKLRLSTHSVTTITVGEEDFNANRLEWLRLAGPCTVLRVVGKNGTSLVAGGSLLMPEEQ